MRAVVAACVVAMLGAPLGRAGDEGAEQLAAAEALAKSGQVVEAAAAYGVELAAAQKQKDLAWQERVARSMASTLFPPTGAAGTERDAYARSLRAVMLALDARRNHAFCSAGQLAHALLLEATRTGDTAYVEEAATVCAQHAKISKVGPFAAAMVDYAAGLLDVAAGNHANAVPQLESALGVTAEQGWAWPAVHVATELAAACVAAGQDDGAAGALAQAGAVLKDSGDTAVAQRFRMLVQARLEGAPEAVQKAWEAALEPFSGGGSVSAAGGRGGAGGSPGGVDVSKVGRAWKKLSGKKPFVTVTRGADGYVIRQAFDKRFEAEQPTGSGVKHHDDGGITLSFWDGGVRLHMVDMEGRQGQPGEASEPGPFVFFDPVARGYVWGVTKAGLVSQVRGR